MKSYKCLNPLFYFFSMCWKKVQRLKHKGSYCVIVPLTGICPLISRGKKCQNTMRWRWVWTPICRNSLFILQSSTKMQINMITTAHKNSTLAATYPVSWSCSGHMIIVVQWPKCITGVDVRAHQRIYEHAALISGQNVRLTCMSPTHWAQVKTSLWIKTECLIYDLFNSLFPPEFSLSRWAIRLKLKSANPEAQGSGRNSEAVPSAFKGNSSPSSHRLAAPYITPSVPECKPRRLVSILSPECKGRVTVWPVCLPSSHLCWKQAQLSFSEIQTTPASENGSELLNGWQTMWENSSWVQVWLCSAVGKRAPIYVSNETQRCLFWGELSIEYEQGWALAYFTPALVLSVSSQLPLTHVLVTDGKAPEPAG